MKLLSFLICVALSLPLHAAQNAPRIWTSTREIRALQVMPNGTLWAATTGGILRFEQRRRRWTKFTRQHGLPSHEWRRVWLRKNTPTFAAMDGSIVQYRRARWQKISSAPLNHSDLVLWRGQKVIPSLDGISIGKQAVPAPAGGALITAVLPRGTVLLAALFGDGLWRYDGKTWSRAFPDLPANARQITALAGDGNSLWLGTRRDGIFRLQNGRWQQFLQGDEPYFHNAQNAAYFQSETWFSTLEDGLVVRGAKGWKHYAPPQISTNAPRHLTAFRGALFVRHGDGRVDKYELKDGRGAWTKNIFAGLPRRPYALAADEKYLYAAAWGGWSRWDGATWRHFFDVPQLKGVPVMGLFSTGENIWLATQSLGAGQWHESANIVHWIDERHGLPDDWVTALAVFNGRIFAGTFVGGLAQIDAKSETARAFAMLRGDNVTALETARNRLWVGTRRGLWSLDARGNLSKFAPPLDSEIQTLSDTPQGLWLGTRTSINLQ